MSALSKVLRSATDGLIYYCPGCESHHRIPVPKWHWDGNAESPSIHPSLNHDLGEGKRCHCVITAGKITFVSDSYHHLSGQTVDMVAINEDW